MVYDVLGALSNRVRPRVCKATVVIADAVLGTVFVRYRVRRTEHHARLLSIRCCRHCEYTQSGPDRPFFRVARWHCKCVLSRTCGPDGSLPSVQPASRDGAYSIELIKGF